MDIPGREEGKRDKERGKTGIRLLYYVQMPHTKKINFRWHRSPHMHIQTYSSCLFRTPFMSHIRYDN